MFSQSHRLGRPAHFERVIRINGNGIIQNKSELRPVQSELDGTRRLEYRLLCPHTIDVNAIGAIRVDDLVLLSVGVDLKVAQRHSGIILNEDVILWAASDTRDGAAYRITSARETA
jgi:hypothetical protein